jgi:hypothetical protein
MADPTTTISYADESELLVLSEIIAEAYNKEAFMSFFFLDLTGPRSMVHGLSPGSTISDAVCGSAVESHQDHRRCVGQGSRFYRSYSEGGRAGDRERHCDYHSRTYWSSLPAINQVFAADLMAGIKKFDAPMEGVHYYTRNTL